MASSQVDLGPVPSLRIRNKGVKKVFVRDIEDAPWNFRTHPSQQTEALAGVIQEIGFYGYPDVYETAEGKLRLCDGHLRKDLLLKNYGSDTEIEVNVTDFDEEEAKKAIVTHDPLAAMAGADAEKLEALLAGLTFDSPAVKAMLDELAESAGIQIPENLPTPGEGGDEFDPEPADGPTRSTLGDLWILGGKHKLLVGDCTSPANIRRLMDGKKARMCFTDPPWNVAIGLDSNPRHRQRKGLENDNLTPEAFRAFIASFAKLMLQVVDGDVYCVLGASEWPTLDSVLRETGFHWSATVIWVKDQFVLGRSKYHRRYEPIWYGWSEKGKSSFCDERNLDDVWEVPRPKRSPDHPTTKPVELMLKAIQNSSVAGDIVYEPFHGSGSTMVAAHRLNRICYGCELSEAFADVILRRAEAEGMTVELHSSEPKASPGRRRQEK